MPHALPGPRLERTSDLSLSFAQRSAALQQHATQQSAAQGAEFLVGAARHARAAKRVGLHAGRSVCTAVRRLLVRRQRDSNSDYEFEHVRVLGLRTGTRLNYLCVLSVLMRTLTVLATMVQ